VMAESLRSQLLRVPDVAKVELFGVQPEKIFVEVSQKRLAQLGLDMNQVLDVIGKGAAQSWQLDNRGKTMVADQFDFGFAVDWMRKDLGLVLDEARRNGARLPVTALVDQFYADVQAQGGNRLDTSSLIKRLK